jgi:hypothetical protein
MQIFPDLACVLQEIAHLHYQIHRDLHLFYLTNMLTCQLYDTDLSFCNSLLFVCYLSAELIFQLYLLLPPNLFVFSAFSRFLYQIWGFEPRIRWTGYRVGEVCFPIYYIRISQSLNARSDWSD